MNTTFTDTYEVKAIIGKGGMSTVYLAEHKRLHTRWAIKEVRKQQGAKFDFLAESNILKRLQHPMLPRIVDIFEDPEYVYIVEDYVEGITLGDLLERQKKIEEAQALQWFRELCGVLRYLHTQKPHPIIYRDMKPSNIMLQPDGTLKLIDFGIAREYKPDSAHDTTTLGTMGYAAPEQFGKAQTTARTDIYSLGVTMYHLLTGKSPYELHYSFEPMRQLMPELSRGIEFVIDKCTRPNPADRYPSVDALLEDIDHMYRFDDAWKRVQRIKRGRGILVAAMLMASVGLMAGGRVLLGREKETDYMSLLSQASELYTINYDGAIAVLDDARALYPERIDADRQQTYALYLNGKWQECIDFAETILDTKQADVQIRLTMASAQFELGEYKNAAEGFAQGSDLSADNLRDYAVCLGRLGKIDEAEKVLNQLVEKGAHGDVTQYVQGEVAFAQKDYLTAEAAFLEVLEETEEAALVRRCYISLGDLYRDCAALVRVNSSPIECPATKSAELLSTAVVQEGLRYDSVLWEMLALAYFEAYHTDEAAPENYLPRAADCFNRVIELGITKEYLYSNLYTIYYELTDYDKAEQALTDYESIYPDAYMPHALRGMMLITIENGKEQQQRDYKAALEEYETAGNKIRSSDETTYYQQLGSLIENLKENGWL